MAKSLLVVLIALSFLANGLVVLAQQNNSNPKVYRFIRGLWFDGKRFKARTYYSVNGVLSERRPSEVAETVDLENKYVIPPFGDAHTHNLDGMFNLQDMIDAYLREGTFYVQVLANHSSGSLQTRPLFNKPATLDVTYANGMLTCTYGHPFMVYEPLAMGIYSPADAFKRVAAVKKSRLGENDAYWFLDSKQDVDDKWDRILASHPDLIKIGLLDAENYDKYVAAGNTLNKGLSPDVAAYVVEKAHRAGLRVFAHIETANDFRLGLKIGLDGFAHLPYYDWDGREKSEPKFDLTEQDIKLAAKKKIIVVPTAMRGMDSAVDQGTDGKPVTDPKRRDRIIARHRKLLQMLYRNRVRIALGLDLFGKTVWPEIAYLHENNIFDTLALLKIAVESTPAVIFPSRKIGKLRSGYEASFLVLNGDPLRDFSKVTDIALRFKQGVFINLRPNTK